MLENSLHHLIQEYHLDELIFEVVDENWTIPILEDNVLNNISFSRMCEDLRFRPFDHLMIAMCQEKVVRVITFQSSDGSKKVLLWF